MIPKVVYQTWKTQRLPLASQYALKRMKECNSEYSFELFDDRDVVNFINSNFDESVRVAYSRLKLGASRADLFRYCVLFVRGGIYVDIDSEITQNLNTLVGDCSACISREKNNGRFVQWMLAFEANHPILQRVIFYAVSEILSRPISDTMDYDILALTGPTVFSRAVVDTIGMRNLWGRDDLIISNYLQHNVDGQVRRTKIFGHDFENYALFTLPYCKLIDVEVFLRHGTLNWKVHEWYSRNKIPFIGALTAVALIIFRYYFL